MVGAVLPLAALFPMASRAGDGGQPAENRWVPSLAIISGGSIQDQDGFANSVVVDTTAAPGTDPEDLRGMVVGDDLAVSPFVGGSVELMTPALPVPTRPRLFLSGEILPTFASDRGPAVEGDPDCIKSGESGSPCATTGLGPQFGESSANGQGTRTSSEIDTLVYGASVGVAFPLQLG